MEKFKFYLIFCGRNDNYADQNDRIPKFIDYYSCFRSSNYDIDLVLIDWNTDPTAVRFAEAFDWRQFENFHSIVVSSDEHIRIDPARKRVILDYAGRNRGLKYVASLPGKGCAVIINQDIFVKQSVFDAIFHAINRDEFFYRADRTDIMWIGDDVRDLRYETLRVHGRLIESPLSYFAVGDRVLFFERLRGEFLEQVFDVSSFWYGVFTSLVKAVYRMFGRRCFPCVLYGLHGNASGDFLVIPKGAIGSVDFLYPETSEFYMHTDSYLLYRLFRAGYKQRIVCESETVLHVDHARNHAAEDWPYEKHLRAFQEIIDGD